MTEDDLKVARTIVENFSAKAAAAEIGLDEAIRDAIAAARQDEREADAMLCIEQSRDLLAVSEAARTRDDGGREFGTIVREAFRAKLIAAAIRARGSSPPEDRWRSGFDNRQAHEDAVGVCRDLARVLRDHAFPTSDVRWHFLQQRAETVVRLLSPPEEACPKAEAGCLPEPKCWHCSYYGDAEGSVYKFCGREDCGEVKSVPGDLGKQGGGR